jgi:hypothetical protein
MTGLALLNPFIRQDLHSLVDGASLLGAVIASVAAVFGNRQLLYGQVYRPPFAVYVGAVNRYSRAHHEQRRSVTATRQPRVAME